MKKATEREGYLKANGFELFYRSFQPNRARAVKGTVLCLHGGPGSTHNYILPLADLTNFGYRVVFYDQLGCGRSELPKNLALFTVERGVEEVEQVRRGLGLGRVNLMGSSWGGLLGIAYALKDQRNLTSLITTGGLASVPLTVSEMERLRSRMPKGTRDVMKKYEDLGQYENSEYEEAVMDFYRRHLCRLWPWPDELIYSHTHISRPVYLTMNGPNEFTIIGTIRYWDATPQLRYIKVPTLVTGGKYDEVTPKVARSIHRGIKGSRLVIFNKSSHLPMWEEREKYIAVLRAFLDRVN